MRRTGHRPLARNDVSPRAALVFGLVLGVDRRSPRSGRSRTGSPALLTALAIAFYVVVYTMLLKRRTAAEHRVGRRGRLHARAHRLGRGHRPPGLGAGGPVRGRVLLDAAALLGPGHPLPRRLRARRHADAAGGRDPAAGGARHRRLRLADRRGVAGPLAAGHRLGLRRARRRRRVWCCWSAPTSSRPGQGRPGSEADGAVPPLQQLPGLPLRRRRASTPSFATDLDSAGRRATQPARRQPSSRSRLSRPGSDRRCSSARPP